MATGDNALLTRASVSFHTNGEDKDDDSRVNVAVRLMDQTLVASIADEFGLVAESRWQAGDPTSQQVGASLWHVSFAGRNYQ